ncbi:MAG: pyruvate ferredoxin oxidoreductase [Candidatus Moranbacteria bacterium]|nr:pyruvate ferredoxin oxidoreductase [Candidatus Moranbacteria bacterium]
MAIKNNDNRKALTGGAAIAEALRQIGPDVMPVYPITPQTPIIETYAKFVADGEADTEMIEVESEHSAISAAVGASAAGARTVTATSSQGLALMHEILYIASGMRLPILMPVAARALASPINIHGDHSDVMGARDAGWIQLFAENPQEAYDKTIIGMRLAEAAKLPVMVIIDGFNTSHSVENLEMLDGKAVKKFVGEYKAEKSLLDVANPVTFGSFALQDTFFEFKIEQEKAMAEALDQYRKIAKEYAAISGREYSLFEKYATKDADKILVMAGSAAGTTKDAIDELRAKGKKVGLIEIELFRPFPRKELLKALSGAKEIIVMDRAQSIGSNPPFYTEIVSAMHDSKKTGCDIRSFIYGIGGRDLFKSQIIDLVNGKIKGKYLN